MPSVNYDNDDHFIRSFQDLHNRVTALESQQNFTVVDSQLRLREVLGLLPKGDYGVAITTATGRGAVGSSSCQLGGGHGSRAAATPFRCSAAIALCASANSASRGCPSGPEKPA